MENHGIYSSRFFGENLSDEDKCKHLLELLKDVESDKRTARFKCAICYIDENGNKHTFEAECEGKIACELKGDKIFGYNQIFEVNGITFGEMKLKDKNKISHRGKALQEFLNFIKEKEKER